MSVYLPTEQAVAQSSPEVIGIERQRKLADLLTAQGFSQPQGQMISGHYVAPSWTQQLAPLANVLAGNAISERADIKQQELAAALRAKQNQVVNAFTEAKTPKEKFAAATSEYAPSWLKSVGAEMLKTQKAGKGDVISQLDLPTGQMQTILEGKPDLPSSIEEYQYAQKDPNFANYQIGLKRAGATNINMPTESERKAGTMVNILDKNLLQMQTALGVDPTAVKPNVPASVVEAISGPNLLSRTMKPAQRQIIEDSQLDVLDAALTLRTGAAYTKEQLEGMRDTYFPKLGDKPAAIQAKKQRLETLIDSAYISAGRATPPRVSAVTPTQTQTPNANKDLNIPSMKLPPGVTPQLWNVMTPEEKAAFK